ncbi:hypothetical protein FRX31_014804 [Thalictrum thalictroides]|uniref:Uncharacterized protein n=1 Tax=Thalictrum thalictroides TaxID=46969 RepID=A0A7J6WGR4_THATH|nr:hypothetical protein FRX31_014804 [Thalictrum thalictroides]
MYAHKIGLLRNQVNDYYCKRLTTEGKTDCLNAISHSITPTTERVVEELVLSRNIYNIEFQTLNARVYSESLIAVATGTAVNDIYGTESKSFTLKMVYKDIKTTTWNRAILLRVELKRQSRLLSFPLLRKSRSNYQLNILVRTSGVKLKL